jgi:hypothetical protein
MNEIHIHMQGGVAITEVGSRRRLDLESQPGREAQTAPQTAGIVELSDDLSASIGDVYNPVG